MKHLKLRNFTAWLAIASLLAPNPALAIPAKSLPPGGAAQSGDVVAADRGTATVGITLNSAASQPSSAFLSSSGTIPAASLPAPTVSAFGGVQAATPTTNQFLTGIGTDGIPTKAQPSFSNISGTLAAGQIPNPSASTLGGVQSSASVANQFLTGISTLGVPTRAQPAFTDISGVAGAAQGGAGSVNGIMKANGSGVVSAAVSGTDFAPATSGTSILKANGTGGFSNAVAGTDYQAPITLTTTGTSGAATLVGNVLNIPQYSGGGGGSVSITSLSPGLVVTPSPLTGTGTLSLTSLINAQGTAASYTVQASDATKIVSHNRSSAVAVTVPQAGTTGFGSGFAWTETNLGAGDVTLTPATSTINGASSFVLKQGESAYITSDGTNYVAIGMSKPVPLTLTTTGTSGAAAYNPTTGVLNIPQYTGGGGGSVTWPTSGNVVVSNGTDTPASVAPVNGNCLIGSGGAWVSGSCSGVSNTNSNNGAASTPAYLLNGTIFTGGSGTTTFPQVLVQPTGATAATDWATGGTAYGVNTATGFNGNFFDAHVNGGSSVFKVSATGNTTLGVAAAYIINARSKLSSPADGIWLMQNNAATGFTRLSLGGTTSSSPAIKVNGTALNFRLADDSADTTITAANVTSSGAFISGGTKFTTSGCSISASTGGATAGTMTSGTTGTCTVTITLPTAPNGWHCAASNRTAKTAMPTTASTTTSCTIEAAATTGDVISFSAMAY